MSLLDIIDVGKSFGGLQALQNINFTVESGEIVGIMGANGAGKTTLFSLIAGHSPPNMGTMTLAGQNLNGLRPNKVCRLGVARTFQIVRPFRNLTVLDNVLTAVLFGRDHKSSRADAEIRARQILEEIGLAERADQAAGTLTLSGQKRLEVAKALATNPRLLMLDEVMAGLTPSEVNDMLTVIRQLRDRYDLTILIIEHVMQALMELSDRIIVLHHGEMIAEGLPEEVAKDPRVLEAYIGEARP